MDGSPNLSKVGAQPPPLIHVLTVATRNNFPLHCWKESLLSSGFPSTSIHILGLGERWNGFDWRTEMYIQKMKELERVHGPNCMCILSDGEDVFFVGGPQEFIYRYRDLFRSSDEESKRVPVFCPESMQGVGRFSRPEDHLLMQDILDLRRNIGSAGKKNENCNDNNNNSNLGTFKQWTAVNCGLCIGTVSQLIALLEMNRGNKDDQEGMQMIALAKPHLLRVDFENRIFGIVRTSYNPIKMIMVKDGQNLLPKEWQYNDQTKRLKYIPSQQEPLALHFAGKLPLYYIVFLRMSGRTDMSEPMKIRLADFIKDMSWYTKEGAKTHSKTIILLFAVIVVTALFAFFLGRMSGRRNCMK